MELSGTEAIKQIVSAGMGIALVPNLSIKQELENCSLVVLDVIIYSLWLS